MRAFTCTACRVTQTYEDSQGVCCRLCGALQMDAWQFAHATGKCVIARTRRGRRVVIPPEWRGKVARPQSIRKRPSKRRLRREPTVQERRAPTAAEWEVA